MRVLISGGGTGGHVYPLLVVVDALQEIAGDDGPDILYVGHAGGLEESILARFDLPFEKVASGPIRGTNPWTLARSLWRLWRGYSLGWLILSWIPTWESCSAGRPLLLLSWGEEAPLWVPH